MSLQRVVFEGPGPQTSKKLTRIEDSFRGGSGFEKFVQSLETLGEADGGIVRLRQLVLELAVIGHLVEHDTTSGPGSAAVRAAVAERQALVNRKEVSRREYAPIPEPDIRLPSSWAWARLGEIVRDHGQCVPDRRFAYIDVSSVDSVRGLVHDDLTVLEPHQAPSRARKLVAPGTVIYSTVRPYLLNVAVIERLPSPAPIVSTAFAILSPLAGILPKFLYFILRSPFFVSHVSAHMKGVAYPAISDGDLYSGWVPVPPLAEQKRIVAKVDELMRMLDDLESKQRKKREAQVQLRSAALGALRSAEGPKELETAWARVAETFEILFERAESVSDLRTTILELATRGRIVGPVRGDEKPSSYLPRLVGRSAEELGLVSDDGLPSSWAKVQVGALFEVGTGSTPTRTNPAYWQNGSIPWTASAATNNRVVERPTDLVTAKAVSDFRLKLYSKGSLAVALYGQGKTRGQVARLGIDTTVNQAVAVIEAIPESDALMDYVWLCFRQKYVELRARAAGGAQPNLNLAVIKSTWIAVPPIKEMRSIVAKVDQLMKLCDDLEAKLQRSEMTAAKLVEAVVAEVVA